MFIDKWYINTILGRGLSSQHYATNFDTQKLYKGKSWNWDSKVESQKENFEV